MVKIKPSVNLFAFGDSNIDCKYFLIYCNSTQWSGEFKWMYSDVKLSYSLPWLWCLLRFIFLMQWLCIVREFWTYYVRVSIDFLSKSKGILFLIVQHLIILFLCRLGWSSRSSKRSFTGRGEVSLKISCARKLYFALSSLMYNEFFIWKNVFLKIFQVFLMKVSPKTSNFVMLL